MADSLVIYRDDQDATGLDLSDYVDLDRGGIDTGDGGARDPVFVGGPQGYGQRLSHVETRNRVFQVPLLLSADTVDELGGLAQRVEAHLGGRRAWIAWQRQGASAATWYRVRYGRLVGDSRYDQRLESQTAHGRRQLVAQVDPYGIGARMRYATSSVLPVDTGATGPAWNEATTYRAGVATRNFASLFTEANPAVGMVPSIGGDGPRMLRMAVKATAPSAVNQSNIGSAFGLVQYVAGFTRVPYSPVFSAASSASSAQAPGWVRLQHSSTEYGPTALGVDPWSPGGGYYVSCPGSPLASNGTIDKMYYPFIQARGRPTQWNTITHADGPEVFRMFACVRVRQHTTAGSSIPARMQFEYDGVPGPVATLVMRSPSQWAWYDVGEMAYFAFFGEGISGIGFEQPTGFTGLASFNFELAAIAGIPADNGFHRVALGGAARDGGDQVVVIPDSDGPLTAAGRDESGGPGLVGGYWDDSSVYRTQFPGDLAGELPVFPPQGSPAASPLWVVALALRGAAAGVTATISHHGRESVMIRFAAYDRYTWAK